MGFLPKEEEEESGSALEAREAAGGEAPWRERENEAREVAAAFFSSLAAVIDVLLAILRTL